MGGVARFTFVCSLSSFLIYALIFAIRTDQTGSKQSRIVKIETPRVLPPEVYLLFLRPHGRETRGSISQKGDGRRQTPRQGRAIGFIPFQKPSGFAPLMKV